MDKVLEIFDNQWGVIAKIERKAMTFMLAIHLETGTAAQIIVTPQKHSVMELSRAELPPVAVFERIFKERY